MYKRIIQKARSFVQRYADEEGVLEQAHSDPVFIEVH